MRKIYLLLLVSILPCGFLFSQIQVFKTDGGGVITKLGLGINVNGNSTLRREYVILNDTSCPLQLYDVGIFVKYDGSGYRFRVNGNIIPKLPIAAYEIHHVLYDVFGSHMKTLSNLRVEDLNTSMNFNPPDASYKGGSWYASENEVTEYLYCISYVSTVRFLSGVIWRYKPAIIKEELNKIKISYEEGYAPTPDNAKK